MLHKNSEFLPDSVNMILQTFNIRANLSTFRNIINYYQSMLFYNCFTGLELLCNSSFCIGMARFLYLYLTGTQLKQDCKLMIHVHCLAHRLALAVSQSAKEVKNLKEYE